MKSLTLLIIFVILIFIDKSLTLANLYEVKKTNINYLAIEKNPIARWFFEKTGLINGTLIYSIISLVTLFLSFYILKSFLGQDYAALWIIILLYSLVIGNNIFFFFKFRSLI